MFRVKFYIIFLGISLCFLIIKSSWFSFDKTLPPSLGDPLELIIINTVKFDVDFYNKLEEFLTVNLGPSPQTENILEISRVSSDKFQGVLRRHQNLLFVERGKEFSLKTQKNIYAENQTIILLTLSSYQELLLNKEKITSLVDLIKRTEINRLQKKFKKNVNLSLKNKILKKYNFSLSPPKGFYLAHEDSNLIWFRRETPKIGQGVLITTLSDSEDFANLSEKQLTKIIDNHVNVILGPVDNSFMVTESSAVIKTDPFVLNTQNSIRVQSLWRIENDFMGGIYVAYFFQNAVSKTPTLIFTYLYAPGERKNISLLQLESLVHTIGY